MATYFLDTLALVKRHVVEPGHAWVQALYAPRGRNSIVVAEVALVEVAAAFSRMVRESVPRLTPARRNRVMSDFDSRFLRQYIVIAVDRSIITRAADLCRTHPLRAYDAIQLACALTRRDDDVADGLPAPTFVCADTALLAAAAAEGLAIENPNSHP
jgi:predicted nucleic acid-binding protein